MEEICLHLTEEDIGVSDVNRVYGELGFYWRMFFVISVSTCSFVQVMFCDWN